MSTVSGNQTLVALYSTPATLLALASALATPSLRDCTFSQLMHSSHDDEKRNASRHVACCVVLGSMLLQEGSGSKQGAHEQRTSSTLNVSDTESAGVPPSEAAAVCGEASEESAEAG
jgi:hypothetical protein